MQARFPNRWKDEFKLDGLGVRFWDDKADNPTGCQVKPDGMLCFTGNEPFMKWEQILGRQWCEEQKVLNLGRAGHDILTDGKVYFEPHSGKWKPTGRTDIILRLNNRGISDRPGKGGSLSDLERVLNHIQIVNRVEGVAPLVNYPQGFVELEGRRILNITDLDPVRPVRGLTGTPADFPWIWEFLQGLFPRPEGMPLHHYLAWLQRSYRGVLYHQKFMGQAIFVCGPRNNGKTLLSIRITKPLLGNRIANPIEFMTGNTDFNSELFESYLLAINDEDSPANEAARRRMNAKLKGLVVNPTHKYHAKYGIPLTIDWCGRVMVTLNDDPGSVGMLPEVEDNTRDKMMFFATPPYKGIFPPQDVLEPKVSSELTAFGWWLLNDYKPPAEVLADDRMGIKSFFDPVILEKSYQQTHASDLADLMVLWAEQDAYWSDDKVAVWTGNPTLLLSCLQGCPGTASMAVQWTQQKVAKSLTTLAKRPESGVKFNDEAGRVFTIAKPVRPKDPDDKSNR